MLCTSIRAGGFNGFLPLARQKKERKNISVFIKVLQTPQDRGVPFVRTVAQKMVGKEENQES